jgi:hypothetical protein
MAITSDAAATDSGAEMAYDTAASHRRYIDPPRWSISNVAPRAAAHIVSTKISKSIALACASACTSRPVNLRHELPSGEKYH